MKDNLLHFLGKSIYEIQEEEFLRPFFSENIVEQIGEEHYVTNRNEGIGFVFDNSRRLISIHLHDGLDKKYYRFVGELPFGLYFTDDIITVQKKIGTSEYLSGGGEVLPFLGISNIWRKYKFDRFSIHIEFHNNGESISLITFEFV